MNKRFLFSAAVSLFFAGSGLAQNDNICSATVLPINTTCTFQAGTNVGSTNSAGIPAPGCASYSGQDVWYRFTVPANGTVTINMNTGTMTDSGMAWYRGACGSPTLMECDDDDSPNGAMSMISSSCLTPGETIWVRIWDYGGGTGTFQICASSPATSTPPGNSICSGMNPICSGSPITFPALSNGGSAFVCNPGNNYSCLLTTPNPTWYYLQIANPGNLAVDMSAASDIDFALWGPYANLGAAQAACGSLPAPIDCSYSTAATEQANANGTLTNQVYVLVVTNYANVPQTITVTTAGSSTATTNCSIVLPVELSAFDAMQVGRNIRLDWATESELNSDFFLIERSCDGQVWQTIGYQDAAGNSQEQLNYSYLDESSVNGLAYYRLKQVDNNGNFDYSPVRSVQAALEYRFEIYPNPADELINIGLEDKDDLVSIELYSLTGTKIPVEYVALKGYAQLDCAPLRSGTYQVLVKTEKHLSKQLVVIK